MSQPSANTLQTIQGNLKEVPSGKFQKLKKKLKDVRFSKKNKRN